MPGRAEDKMAHDVKCKIVRCREGQKLRLRVVGGSIARFGNVLHNDMFRAALHRPSPFVGFVMDVTSSIILSMNASVSVTIVGSYCFSADSENAGFIDLLLGACSSLWIAETMLDA